jgi:hypothetical protein
MNTQTLVFATILSFASCLYSQELFDETLLLNRLRSADMHNRYEAFVELQTSLDPRIPEACLPLLQLEGDTTRRLAARAIGSRWHQISKERLPVFTAALKAQLKSDEDGLVNMARRGIALLNRNYGDTMVSRSKSKRWVIYERRLLPCLIDTHTMTEELLGYPEDENQFSMEGEDNVKWHPKQDMVALALHQRRTSFVWVWVHGKGLRKLETNDLIKTLGDKARNIKPSSGFHSKIIGWKGDSLDFTLLYESSVGDDWFENEATLRWNATTDNIIIISDKKVQ